MKRFLWLQLLLLIVGIGWLTYAFFKTSLLLPVDELCCLLKLPLRTSKVVLSRQRLTLYDVKGKLRKTPFKASRMDFSLLKGENFFERRQCEIRGGTLETPFGKLNTIDGLVQKNGDDYRALLSARHETFGLLQTNIHSFNALLQPYKALSDKTFPQNPPLSGGKTESFSIKNLRLHTTNSKGKLSALFQIDEAAFADVRATDIFGQTHFDEESALILLRAQQIDTPKFFSMIHPLADGTYIFKDSHLSAEFQGYADMFPQPIGFYGCVENFQPDINNKVQFCLDGALMEGSGQCWFYPTRKEGSLSKVLLIADPHLCNPMLNVPQNPYRISLNEPLVARIDGNLQQASMHLTTSDFGINGQPFRCAEADVSKNGDVFSWNATFRPTDLSASGEEKSKISFKTHGTCDLSEQKGHVFCNGTVAPDWINALGTYLPPWWDEFSNNFRFFGKNPCVDATFQWDRKQHLNNLFGYAEAEDGRYKQTDFQKTAVTFSHQTGYAKIKLHRLKTPEGEGFCCIRRPYDPQDEQREQFDFDGSGTFSVRHWETLIKDFVGISDTEYLKRLHPLIPTKASFKGCVSFPALPNDYWEVKIQSPTHKIDTVPVKDLDIAYRRDGEKTQANLQGKLFHAAPFKTNLRLYKETFEIEAEGEQVPTELLLQQPMFSKWVAEIPPDNLKTYGGRLELRIKAKGRYFPEFSVDGEGFADFKNPELSQIHLLGPLQRLLFAKIPFLPTVDFNRFTSEFSFNEHEIRTQKAELTGDTAQADLKGVADLENHRLKGELNFSFLDHRQMGIPIVRHAFQIFTPLTRAFSVSVNGSFGDPRYFVTFNPVRWALPKAARPKKKP